MSYTCLLYHIVFRTKYSIPAIPFDHAEKLYAYIWGIVKNKKSILYRIGGMPDHIHMLIDLHPSIALSDFMHDTKLAISRFMNQNKNLFPDFQGWGDRYAAFSYGQDKKETIIRYIMNQQEHHKTVSFADEFRAFIESNGGVINEKYFLKD